MRVLRPLNLPVTLLGAVAVVGACALSHGAQAGGTILQPIYGSHPTDSYNGPVANPCGGGAWLPPATYVIDAPLRGFDNGYNPTYYWNRGRLPAPAAYVPSDSSSDDDAGIQRHRHHHRHHGHRVPVDRSDNSNAP